MAESSIQLDRSLPYSECRGERMPDDPHYKVHFFQTYKVGKKSILLPFDAHGDLVEDDGRTQAYQSFLDGKPVMYQPLYDAHMRDLVKKLNERNQEPEPEDEDPAIAGSADADAAGKGFDLRDWLRTGKKHPMTTIRNACRVQYGLNLVNNKQVVEALVFDEKIIPESELHGDLKHYITK